MRRLSLRPILRRMRQRPFVLEHLSKFAAINPPPQAGQRMKCSASSVTGAPTRSPLYLPRGMSGAFTASFLLAPTQHIGGRIHGAVEVGLAYRDFMNFAAVGATQSERFRPRFSQTFCVGLDTGRHRLLVFGHLKRSGAMAAPSHRCGCCSRCR